MKKNSKNSQKNKTTLLKRIAIALAILLVFVLAGWFIYEKVKEDGHIQDIRSASQRLEEIFHSIESQVGPNNIFKKEFRKTCGEMNVKYGRGPIVCGPSFEIHTRHILGDDQLEKTIITNLEHTPAIRIIDSTQSSFSSTIMSRWVRFDDSTNMSVGCHLEIVIPPLEYYNKYMSEGKDAQELLAVIYGSCSSKYTFNNYIPDFTRTN